MNNITIQKNAQPSAQTGNALEKQSAYSYHLSSTQLQKNHSGPIHELF
jgi:hypothetical protein